MKETADSRFEEEVKQSKTKVIVEEYEKLSSSLIFEIIRHDGEKELDRATGGCQEFCVFRLTNRI